MPRVDQSTINWAVYEDNTEYAGMAQATLPNLTALTQSISGAGIAGNVDAVILGHFDAMSMTLNYRTMTEQAVRLSEPRRHNIDLRYAVQDEDPVAAAVQIRAIKHILVVIPKTHTPGTVAPATPENGTGEFAVGICGGSGQLPANKPWAESEPENRRHSHRKPGGIRGAENQPGQN